MDFIFVFKHITSMKLNWKWYLKLYIYIYIFSNPDGLSINSDDQISLKDKEGSVQSSDSEFWWPLTFKVIWKGSQGHIVKVTFRLNLLGCREHISITYLISQNYKSKVRVPLNWIFGLWDMMIFVRFIRNKHSFLCNLIIIINYGQQFALHSMYRL